VLADGKYCLTGGSDRSIRLFNPFRIDPVYYSSSPGSKALHREQQIPHALPIQSYVGLHAYPITSLALDASSVTLLSSSEKTVGVSNLLTGQLIRKLRAHDGRINSITCSPDATIIVSGSYDTTVKVWDGRTRSSDPLQTFKDAKDSISKVMVDMDKKEILSCSVDGCIRIYDIRKGQVRVDQCCSTNNETTAIVGMCLSHDGACVAVSCLNGTIYLLERDSGDVLQSYANSHTARTYGLDCAITATDETVVSGSEDGNVVLYDLVTGKRNQILIGHTKPTCSVAAHPNRASVVLSASYDGNAIVWSNESDIQEWER
jgi:mitogen-activated protein kinase organizer 1